MNRLILIYFTFSFVFLSQKVFCQQDSMQIIKEYYPNSEQLMLECTLLNGLCHGVYNYYNVDGKKVTMANYDYGKLEGYVYSYDEDGKLKSITEYHLDYMNGIQLFYKNGILYQIYHMKENLPNGSMFQFYPTGEVGYFVNFIDGIKVGIEYHYYINGQVSKQVPYNQEGKTEGEVIEYDEDGKLIKKTFFKNEMTPSR